jgi:hypothetical protein
MRDESRAAVVHEIADRIVAAMGAYLHLPPPFVERAGEPQPSERAPWLAAGLVEADLALLAWARGDPATSAPIDVGRVTALVRRFGRFVRKARPVALRRRVRVSWAVFAITIVGSASAFLYVSTRPLPALRDDSFAHDRGGIVGRYFKGKRFETLARTRTDAQINFSAENGVLVPEVGGERYSVRWEGFLLFEEGGRKRLCVERDDGARLFFAGELLLDYFTPASPRVDCATIRVERGWYPLRVDFFQETGGAVIRLLEKRGASREIVVAERLCCRTSAKVSR